MQDSHQPSTFSDNFCPSFDSHSEYGDLQHPQDFVSLPNYGSQDSMLFHETPWEQENVVYHHNHASQQQQNIVFAPNPTSPAPPQNFGFYNVADQQQHHEVVQPVATNREQFVECSTGYAGFDFQPPMPQIQSKPCHENDPVLPATGNHQAINDGNICQWMMVQAVNWSLMPCQQVFGGVTELAQHVTAAHVRKEAPKTYFCCWYKCSRKGRPFKEKAKLIAHIRTHTGEKPFTCTYWNCGMTFGRAENFAIHRRTHTGKLK